MTGRRPSPNALVILDCLWTFAASTSMTWGQISSHTLVAASVTKRAADAAVRAGWLTRYQVGKTSYYGLTPAGRQYASLYPAVSLTCGCRPRLSPERQARAASPAGLVCHTHGGRPAWVVTPRRVNQPVTPAAG